MVRCGKCRFCYQLHNKSWCDYIEDYVRDDSSCEHGEFPEDYSEPQTRADRIRAMTDVELAEFLNSNAWYRVIKGVAFTNETWTLDWLRKEAEEGET